MGGGLIRALRSLRSVKSLRRGRSIGPIGQIGLIGLISLIRPRPPGLFDGELGSGSVRAVGGSDDVEAGGVEGEGGGMACGDYCARRGDYGVVGLDAEVYAAACARYGE